jgi:hypothetical protein
MRQFLTAVCIVSGFALMADAAVARPRMGLGSSTKPAVAKNAPRPDVASAKPGTPAKPATTASAQERAPQVTPRGWVVAVPRAQQQPAPAQGAFNGDTASAGALANSAGANDIGGASSSPTPAKAMPEPQPLPKPDPGPQVTAKPNVDPQVAAAKPVKPADVAPSPAPVRKRVAAAPQQQRDYAICYWDRTGRCVP